MLHELFITHCTNGTSIMNPFTSLQIVWLTFNHTCEQKYTCTHVCACSHIHVHMDKSTYICAKTWKFSYVCIWTHLLCICQQMHLVTCEYVNVDRCINIVWIHSYALYVSISGYICSYAYAHIHISCIHVHLFQHLCVLKCPSLHIHMLIYIHMH